MSAPGALLILAFALTSMVQAAPAQTESREGGSDTSAKEHRVVFEIVGESPEYWKALLNNVENVPTHWATRREWKSSRTARVLGFC